MEGITVYYYAESKDVPYLRKIVEEEGKSLYH